MPDAVSINPDDFLETADGRVWTPERNAAAWQAAYAALEEAIGRAPPPVGVVIVCGPQGAGKSTWIAARPPSPSTIHVDAALPGARHRAPIIAIAQRLGCAVDAVWIDTAVDVAIARNAARPADKVVPVAAIRSVAAQFEVPTMAEGFDRIAIHRGE
jgi:predicted kinase